MGFLGGDKRILKLEVGDAAHPENTLKSWIAHFEWINV